MGFCLYGNDINDTTSPLEAGLGWITKFDKEFTNSENLKKQKEAGVTRKLVAFELTERGIPRHDYEIADANGNVVGFVTSGTQSPSLGIAIGMGYVPTALATPDSEIYIRIRNKDIKASTKQEAAAAVGKSIAELATKAGVESVAFDRNGYLYHGRVKVLAEAAREAGLKF